MSPQGWLDVHTHFALPITDDEASVIVQQMRDAHFMVTSPAQIQWTAEKVLEYNDHAGVAMSLLSYIPPKHDKLRVANDFAHDIVKQNPHRFGYLAALPTDDADACLEEIKRVQAFDDPISDGFAVTTIYNGTSLSAPSLDSVWKVLDEQKAVVHIHPNAYSPSTYGRTVALVDVAFDTTQIAVDMLYKGVFRRFPNIKFIFAHCGGALPALSGRIKLLGTEPWVPNPLNLTREEIENALGSLYVDTAATAKSGLVPALRMVGKDNCVYGADCGVPCSSWGTMDENIRDVTAVEKEMALPNGTVRENTWKLFPRARERAERATQHSVGTSIGKRNEHL